ISVERGVDPRAATLVAFGGGGPLHACGLAEQLAMTRVLIPPHAGVLSAIGLALAPERREGLASLLVLCDALSGAELKRIMQAQTDEVRGVDGDALTARCWVRARYIGQGYELEIAVADDDDGTAIAEKFTQAHDKRMGFTLDRGVECVSLRVSLVGEAWPARFARVHRDEHIPDDVDDGRMMDRTIRGPFTVRLPDATMHIGAGWTARALPGGGWLMEQDS
ncbi:MAG: hypothetical protein M3Y64_06100, partial [Gemmatimonadota bacterium]|nr:hypothetical protein [Gemmatimonadota bacterium]